MHPKYKALLLLALCFLFGAGVGYSLHSPQTQSLSSWGPVRTPPGEYKMIRPLLACDFPFDASNERLNILKSELENDIHNVQKTDTAITASVYVRSMNTGGSIGVDETKLYDPASMFKVVLMMTYARMSESHPDLFAQKLTMSERVFRGGDTDRYYSSTTLVVGESYRIGDLIDTMIISSDNGAKDLLLANISTDELLKTIKDFGLEVSHSGADNLKMSPKDISLFFRTLYSATYLDNLHSEIALELLSRTTFKDGLVAGIPYGTTIAHKYGEFISSSSGGNIEELELHDCGIVYAPSSPYFLCMMTKGGTHAELSALIATLSQHTYYEMTTPR